MKTIKELTNEIMDNIDFVKLHKQLAFPGGFSKIWLYKDGHFHGVTGGTVPNPEAGEPPILCLDIFDWTSYDYLEGWGTLDSETEIFTTDEGIEMTWEDAVIDAIENGDWHEWERQIESKIYQKLLEEQEAEEYRNLSQES